MSKVKKIIIVIVIIVVIGLGGLYYIGKKSNEMFDKAVNYLNNKEYNKANTTLDIILDDNKNNEKANKLDRNINDYLESKKLYDENNLKEAKEKIGSISDIESYKTFKEDVDNLNAKISESLKNNSEVDNKLKKVRELIDNKKFTDAKKILDELKKQELDENRAQQVKDLEGRVKSEIDKEKENKKEQEAKRKAEEAKRSDEAFIERFKNSNKELTKEEAERLLNIKVGDNGKVVFTYINSTGVQASVLYEFLQNYTTSHTHGPHVYVNASTGEITTENWEVLSPEIRPIAE